MRTQKKIQAYVLITMLLMWSDLSSKIVGCLDNDLAKTPPMGWLAGKRFNCETDCVSQPDDCISNRLFEQMSDRIVCDSYYEVGYEYVNIDDCLSATERHHGGNLNPDFSRFPDGIGGLAYYVHSKGLKLGIYGHYGNEACRDNPDQLKSKEMYHSEGNYFEIDADRFADWQIDSFRFDGCNFDLIRTEYICPQISKALNATRRHILFSCQWPAYLIENPPTSTQPDFALISKSCNVWRFQDDTEDSWSSILNIVDNTIRMQSTILEYHGPGNWFDPGLLMIGNFGLSLEQAKAQMAIWCIWSAPLYMSNDLRSIDAESASVLKNRKLVNVNQDDFGVLGLMVDQTADGLIQAFVKPIQIIKRGCPSFAIVYLNRNTPGNGKLISFSVRELLKKSAIVTAAQRYEQKYAGNIIKPGGGYNISGFTSAGCMNRLIKAMTRDPISSERSIEMPNSGPNLPIEEQLVKYEVDDILEGKLLSSVSLNGTLNLFVNPNGARAVTLREIVK